MSYSFDTEKLKLINRMILEMASGNFHYRLNRTSNKGDIEALVATLNMLGEEIQHAMISYGYAQTDRSFLHSLQMTFLLDKKGVVTGSNKDSCMVLGKKLEQVLDQEFSSFLTPESKPKWLLFLKQSEGIAKEISNLELTFIAQNGLEIPKDVYISRFVGNDIKKVHFVISILHHSKAALRLGNNLGEKLAPHTEVDKNIKSRPRLTHDDTRKIRQAHQIILNNLEKDFPPLKEFALQIGTNEFKLKYGFKEIYGITVHRFLMQERFRKAMMLIQHTDKSLKTIASTTGFKSFSHFSRSFKKRFGYNPSSLRKITTD